MLRLSPPHCNSILFVALTLVAAAPLGCLVKGARGPKSAPSAPTGEQNPQTVTAEQDPQAVTTDRTLEENLNIVYTLYEKFDKKSKYHSDDPRRTTDPLYVKYTTERNKLIEMYRDRELPSRELLMLCQAVLGLGPDVLDAGVAFCQRCMEAEPSDAPGESAKSVHLVRALSHWEVATTYYNMQLNDEAELAFRDYQTIYCGEDVKESEKDRCRLALTEYLPAIYHRRGDLGGLVDLLDECWAGQYESDFHLRLLRGFILATPWKKEILPRVEKIARYVVTKDVWADPKKKNLYRRLVPAALSAMARLALIEKDCTAARSIYLNYDFDHPEAGHEWLENNVRAPSRMLCNPAPSIDFQNWLHGRKPTLLPGGGAADRLILLHFTEFIDADSMKSLATMSSLADRLPDKVQVVSFVPLSGDLFNTQTSMLQRGLTPDVFRERVADLTRDLSQPVGILDQGMNDPIVARFNARSMPTTVLIDRTGQIVAFASTAAAVGWEYVVGALADGK